MTSPVNPAMPSTPVPALNFDLWFNQYQPLPNKGVGGGFENEQGQSTLHETSGADLAEVQRVAATEPARVWTLVDSDGDMSVTSGCHFVNRVGYFITTKPWEHDQPIDIDLFDEEELAEIEANSGE